MPIQISKDTISPELQRIIAICKRPKPIMQAGAKAMQKQVSDHLRQLQERGNEKGWPSKKFFAGKATSVEKNVGISKVTDKEAEVTIADPRFVHRITGGTVTPKRKKNIAIPLTAEAYARSGKGSIKESMPGLFVVKFKRGLYLVREVAERTRAGATGGRQYNRVKRLRVFPLFKLVKRVTHRPRPQEMPDANKLGAAANTAMTQAAAILFKVGQK